MIADVWTIDATYRLQIKTSKATLAMTPVTITHRAPNLRTGRTEIWQARSTDGVWQYDREDEIYTPWVITHLPTGQTWEDTSLRRARHATATRLAGEVAQARPSTPERTTMNGYTTTVGTTAAEIDFGGTHR
jgi:hypothetical protein